jgi:hypothetical protein
MRAALPVLLIPGKAQQRRDVAVRALGFGAVFAGGPKQAYAGLT